MKQWYVSNRCKHNTRALRECKPPPTPKFKPKVVRDVNPNFHINPDLDVCRICPKMSWIMHYLVGVKSFCQVWYKLAVDCMRIANKCPKIPYSTMVNKMKKWSRIHTLIRITTKSYSLLEGHPLPMPAKFGRRPFPQSSVILTEWKNDHITSTLLAGVRSNQASNRLQN